MKHRDNSLIDDFFRITSILHRLDDTSARGHGPRSGTHRGQGRVLALLRLHPEIGQRKLAHLLDMRPQSLGEVLMRLERAGLISRAQAKNDRRAFVISLTAEGKKAADAVGDEQRETDRIFDFLTKDEREHLTTLLTHVREELQKKAGGPQPEAAKTVRGAATDQTGAPPDASAVSSTPK